MSPILTKLTIFTDELLLSLFIKRSYPFKLPKLITNNCKGRNKTHPMINLFEYLCLVFWLFLNFLRSPAGCSAISAGTHISLLIDLITNFALNILGSMVQISFTFCVEKILPKFYFVLFFDIFLKGIRKIF